VQYNGYIIEMLTLGEWVWKEIFRSNYNVSGEDVKEKMQVKSVEALEKLIKLVDG
jgi:hypothetical protein